jgi:hypothetical protein
MYISLSSSFASYACAIRQSIDNYTQQKGETQFFDWLVCSLKSVNEVLSHKPILFEEKFEYPNPLNTVSIHFKNFDLLLSHHDIDKPHPDAIKEITEKYTRRFVRFIQTLQTEKEINFIRYCRNQSNLEEYEIHLFYIYIKNYNPNLKFKFILVSDENTLQIPPTLKTKENFIYINLNDHLDLDTKNELNEYFRIIKMYKCVYNLVK